MNPETMKARTKEFAKRIIRLCRTLPDTREGWRIGDQLFRSGTSIGANYWAACRGRSRADFIAKLGIALEETDESLYWLELMAETEMVKAAKLESLMQECRELLAIFVASMNTAKERK
jgi:four helix bundle protein